MRAKIYKSKVLKGHQVMIYFDIPRSLAEILQKRQLSNHQKMNLVKSYTEDLKDEKGESMERISNQTAVVLLMALELEAL
jgi:hypothetical protein